MKKFLSIILIAILLFSNAQCVLADEKEVVLVLDPGHDSTHGGASMNGISETPTNLKIAQYCYEELKTYKNVKVYMTRTSNACPYPNAGSAGKDNNARVDYAKSVGADAYIAFHLNSYTASMRGVEVYVPNKGWRSEIGEKGYALGESIAKQLVALGLKADAKYGAVRTRNSENGTKYADGSIADYYGVIKRAKENNLPGIIIEHAYLSNTSDVQEFLSTDAKLKALGVADAKGIAEYYGLEKEGATPEPEPTPQPKPEPAPTPKPEPAPEPTETESEEETESETETESEEETEKETESEIETESEEETQTEIETETEMPTEIPVGDVIDEPTPTDHSAGWMLVGIAAIIVTGTALGIWRYKKNNSEEEIDWDD